MRSLRKKELFLTWAKPTANSIQSVGAATATIAEQTIKLFVSRVFFVFSNSYCSHGEEEEVDAAADFSSHELSARMRMKTRPN